MRSSELFYIFREIDTLLVRNIDNFVDISIQKCPGVGKLKKQGRYYFGKIAIFPKNLNKALIKLIYIDQRLKKTLEEKV